MKEITIIAPIWGERYLSRFLDLILPSWLSPGNIPGLAEAWRVRLVILSRNLDITHFKRSRIHEALKAFAVVDCLPIDDLLGSRHMPVTLTLAFQRGMNHVAAEGKDSFFIFLNADFIIADGGLQRVGQRLANGERLLLSPSLRVTAERALPILQSHISDDVILNLSSRSLVRLAFDSLHHTVLSSRIDQSVLISHIPHQICWRVDSNTLLYREFCMFTLAAHIKDIPPPVQTFCDYGMGELLVPEEAPHLITDSDEFLAIELSGEQQEAEFTELGTPDPKDIAGKLGRWTTDFHRLQALKPAYFRAGDSNEALLNEYAKLSQDETNAILSLLAPPLPVVDHPHWKGTIDEWRTHRRDIGIISDPPEIRHIPATELTVRTSNAELRGGRGAVRRFLMGTANHQKPWHPYWLLAQALSSLAQQAVVHKLKLEGQGPTILAHSLDLIPQDSERLETSGVWQVNALDLMRLADAGRQISLALNGKRLSRLTLLLYRSDGRSLAPHDVVRILENTKMHMDIEQVTHLSYDYGVEAHYAYGRVADGFSVRQPVKSFILCIKGLWALGHVLLNNKKRMQDNSANVHAASAILLTGTLSYESDADISAK